MLLTHGNISRFRLMIIKSTLMDGTTTSHQLMSISVFHNKDKYAMHEVKISERKKMHHSPQKQQFLRYNSSHSDDIIRSCI